MLLHYYVKYASCKKKYIYMCVLHVHLESPPGWQVLQRKCHQLGFQGQQDAGCRTEPRQEDCLRQGVKSNSSLCPQGPSPTNPSLSTSVNHKKAFPPPGLGRLKRALGKVFLGSYITQTSLDPISDFLNNGNNDESWHSLHCYSAGIAKCCISQQNPHENTTG